MAKSNDFNRPNGRGVINNARQSDENKEGPSYKASKEKVLLKGGDRT